MAPFFALGIALALAGIVGTVLPLLPGPPLVFLGLFVAAWADGFTRVGWFTLSALAVLTLATVAIDLLAASWGARRKQASRSAVAGACIGSIVGLFAGLPGLVIGPFLGAALGEYYTHRELRGAGRVGLSTWLGLVIGGALRLGLVAVMVLWFAVDFAG